MEIQEIETYFARKSMVKVLLFTPYASSEAGFSSFLPAKWNMM